MTRVLEEFLAILIEKLRIKKNKISLKILLNGSSNLQLGDREEIVTC